MQTNQQAPRFRWPNMILSFAGDLVIASSTLTQLLRLTNINCTDDLLHRFEMFNTTGQLIVEKQTVWKRAIHDHEFETRQIWVHRETARKVFLRIQCQLIDRFFLLSFEDEARDDLTIELVNLLENSAAELIGADGYDLVAHTIVHQVSKTLKTDIAYLATPYPDSLMKVVASIGFPKSDQTDQLSLLFEGGYHTEKAVHSGQIQQVGEIESLSQKEIPALKQLLKIGIRSYAVAPLTWEGDLLGVVSIARKMPGNLAPLETRILKSLALAGAIALRKAKIKRSEKDTFFRVQAVNSLLELESGKSLHLLLKDLVQKGCDLTGARYGAIGVLNKEKTGLADFIPIGMPEETIRKIGHLPEGKGLLGAVIQGKKTMRVANIKEDQRSIGFPAHHPRMTSFLGVPIRVSDEVFGNFYLTDKNLEQEFTKEDEHVIELLGSHASLAIGYAKQLEIVTEERSKSEKQSKELDRLREEFAAIVAHDLRNPIQAIVSRMELLLLKAPKKDGDFIVPESALTQIQNSAFRLAQMANDLLDASRIEVERVHLNRQPEAAWRLIPRLVNELSSSLVNNPVSTEIKESAPTIFVDQLRLGQILSNLLENAGKFSPAGAPIKVEVATARDGGCLIQIKDKGFGIAQSEIPRLFDRFYQTKRAREKKTGLGLGLYITRGLVQAHQGKIWVESKSGEGSTFSVWLPPYREDVVPVRESA